MRLIERPDRPEQHFSEGEPDLEPPEELCVAEVDADLALEEDLDCEALTEDDVEERMLEETLEELAHGEDDHPGWATGPDEFRCRRCLQICHSAELEDVSRWECRSCAG